MKAFTQVNWYECSIRSCLIDEFPGAWGAESMASGDNVAVLRSTDLDDDGHINFETAALRFVSKLELSRKCLRHADILLEASGGGPGKPVGRVAEFKPPDEENYLCSNFFRVLRPDREKVNPRFLGWRLLHLYRQSAIWSFQQQTTGIINLKLRDYLLQRICLPELPEQVQIAEILDTADEAIKKTEAVIAKLKQVRAGMLHDLLTRGLDENAQNRDPITQPEKFKDSPVGPIPKSWRTRTLRELVPVAEYGISSPLFDSGKTPVLRMNNLSDGETLLTDLRFTDAEIPEDLILRPNDVLFNRTNSMLHVGRTGIWRGQVEHTTFASYLVRLSPDPNLLTPEYLNLLLNLPETQIKMRRFATPAVQQVNINPTNLRKIVVAVPNDLQEQILVSDRISKISETIRQDQIILTKMQSLKYGLMSDLLTGRMRVPQNLELPE